MYAFIRIMYLEYMRNKYVPCIFVYNITGQLRYFYIFFAAGFTVLLYFHTTTSRILIDSILYLLDRCTRGRGSYALLYGYYALKYVYPVCLPLPVSAAAPLV